MATKQHGQFYWLPPQAKIGVSDNNVTFTDLAELVASLSFDNPTAKVSYSIEVIPTEEVPEKKRGKVTASSLPSMPF